MMDKVNNTFFINVIFYSLHVSFYWKIEYYFDLRCFLNSLEKVKPHVYLVDQLFLVTVKPAAVKIHTMNTLLNRENTRT